MQCSPDHFDTYFRFSPSGDVLSAREITTLIAHAGEVERLRHLFLDATSTRLANGSTKAQLLLKALRVHADENSPIIMSATCSDRYTLWWTTLYWQRVKKSFRSDDSWGDPSSFARAHPQVDHGTLRSGEALVCHTRGLQRSDNDLFDLYRGHGLGRISDRGRQISQVSRAMSYDTKQGRGTQKTGARAGSQSC